MLKKHKLNTFPSEIIIMPTQRGKYAVVEKKYIAGKRPTYLIMESFDTYIEAVAQINRMR